MKSHPPRNPDQTELFRSRLDSQNNITRELVQLCHQHGVRLRRRYARLGPRCQNQANRYGYAWRMRRQNCKLQFYLRRVVHDIERKIAADDRCNQSLVI